MDHIKLRNGRKADAIVSDTLGFGMSAALGVFTFFASVILIAVPVAIGPYHTYDPEGLVITLLISI